MLNQTEADSLIKMPKKRVDNEIYYLPMQNEAIRIPIISIDEKEKFLIDINRKGKLKLTKCTYQERYQETIILVRLDIDGSLHDNPEVENIPNPVFEEYNGKTIKCPHLHMYIEGFMDKWAIPAPVDVFPNINDIFNTLQNFFKYCNIIEKPNIQKILFA